MNKTQYRPTNRKMLKFLESIKSAQKKNIPHCANPDCPNYHHDDPDDTSWYKLHSKYETKAFGTVTRYYCIQCNKTVSPQTFSIDYYVKKPVDYIQLLLPLVSSMGQGNITRITGLRGELIQNRYERLTRSFLAMHSSLRQLIRPDEDFVLDGFESFSRSQYFPNNINILTGDKSEFIYGIGFSQLRRKGKMTPRQKKRRKALEEKYGRACPKAVEHSVSRLMSNFSNLLSDNKLEKKVLKTDEHKAYIRGLSKIPGIGKSLIHQQYSSKLSRSTHNPLFAVNYIDRQLRKDQANHVRETVQFARCPSAMMSRLTVYQFYHNYLVPRRVRQQRKGNWETRSEFLGLTWEQLLNTFKNHWGRRGFYHKSDLWDEEKTTWLMGWRNSQIPMGRYVPKYIAA